MRARRPAWITALAIASLATISGLWLVTNAVQTLEAQHADSQGEVARAETLRLALWRMDGWMTPRLAREAARPVNEYAAFFSPLDPVNKLLQSVPKGEVLTPSPLLLSTPDWIPLHFELRADGVLSSPQVPQGNLLDLAEGQYFEKGVPVERAQTLKRLTAMLSDSTQSLEACMTEAELSNAKIATAWTAPSQQAMTAMGLAGGMSAASKDAAQDAPSKSKSSAKGESSLDSKFDSKFDSNLDSKRAIEDYTNRAKASNDAQRLDEQLTQSRAGGRGARQQAAAPAQQLEGVLGKDDGSMLAQQSAAQQAETIEDSIGPLVPTWLSTEPPELVFVRRVREGGESRVQGFLVDWTQLSTALLTQVADLTSGASLVPAVLDMNSFAPARLASIPAELRGEFILTNPVIASSTSAPALFFAWGAALLALAAAALAAWTSISFGDRQARFASSVTHELRTPLTTFQLYAEMLRDGMVTDETRRAECLDTLCRESIRLSHLVENVLSLSRLERGARPARASSTLLAIDLTRLVEAVAAERAPNASCRVNNELDNGPNNEPNNGLDNGLDNGPDNGPKDATVRIDRDALTQILANLIENAAKYGGRGEDAAQIDVDIRARGDALVIVVSDHGDGISARAAHAIWRPFDRAGREGGAQFGLGLGLAVSRALAEGKGGSLSLRARSSDALGASFELHLPDAVHSASR